MSIWRYYYEVLPSSVPTLLYPPVHFLGSIRNIEPFWYLCCAFCVLRRWFAHLAQALPHAPFFSRRWKKNCELFSQLNWAKRRTVCPEVAGCKNPKLKSAFEHIELPAKLLDYFLRFNKSNINQSDSIGIVISFLRFFSNGIWAKSHSWDTRNVIALPVNLFVYWGMKGIGECPDIDSKSVGWRPSVSWTRAT